MRYDRSISPTSPLSTHHFTHAFSFLHKGLQRKGDKGEMTSICLAERNKKLSSQAFIHSWRRGGAFPFRLLRPAGISSGRAMIWAGEILLCKGDKGEVGRRRAAR